MDAAGDMAAIWTRRTSNAGDYHVESAVKPAGGALQPPEPRSPTTGNSDCNVDIHMTPGGNVTAMWDFNDTVNPTFVSYEDRSAPFASGTWGGAAKLSVPSVTSFAPAFSLDEHGDTAATWLAGGQLFSAVRRGSGGFTPAKALSGATGTSPGAVGASPTGDALAAFVGMSNGTDAIFGAHRGPTTDFGEVTPVATTPPGAVSLDSPDVALDDQGNGFAAWERNANNTYSVQVAGYDPVAPAISVLAVPAAGTAGQPVGMAATATDRMSGAAVHFDFGDGGGADGAGVTHVYGAAGAYTVTATATDGAGNRSSAAAVIQIAPAPAGGGGAGGGGGGGPKVTPSVAAVTSLTWDRLSSGSTRIKTLVLERLAGPEKVRLACLGRRLGCRKAATRTITRHGRKLSLTKYVKGMTLRPRAQITLTVTRPGYIARIFKYTMVNRRDPRKTTRCLAPGAKKSRTC
ncbi:PKD domain-containing protein [Baekduia soli]|uniref:PKD domain-containing protein n=2 Tax=Baekduia soli TaxID=496014 RepID=A0A5B8UCN2_9ACTN|nr:PKD domain-containing protein [Baekduia soli]